jgi:hypothetical protein
VRPFYLKLLHGNFVRPSEADSGFGQAIANAASVISDQQIEQLLIDREWRGRLCAAWFIGLNKRTNFIRSIGELLLASELTYAGEGYCVALGLIANEECAQLLHSYLKIYLPLKTRVYNQDWAIGALTYIEGAPPSEYLEQSLWREGDYFMDPAKGIRHFGEMVSYLRQHHLVEDAKPNARKPGDTGT